MTTLSAGDPCPDCGHPLEGLARKCWAGIDGCGWTAPREAGEPDHSGEGIRRDTDPSPVPPRSEKEIQWEIRRALTQLGYVVYDLSQPHRALITPGVPDLYVAGFGVTAWLEVKGPRGRQSEAQSEFEKSVRDNGGACRIVRSAEEAVKVMKTLQRTVA